MRATSSVAGGHKGGGREGSGEAMARGTPEALTASGRARHPS